MHAVADLPDLASQTDSDSLSQPRDPGITVQATAELLKLSMIGSPRRRMAAIFLGREIKSSCFQPAEIVTRLMSQCLDGFVRASGGEIVYAADFDDPPQVTEIAPFYTVVTTDASTFRFLSEGFLFIQLPGDRVVVELRHTHSGPETIEGRVEIRTAGDSQSFFRKWTAYTRENHFLRQRAAFADGEPIIHSRRYTWNDIVLPEHIRATLRTHVETFLAHVPRLKAAGMKTRRGLILSGPPGTGKTLIGKVLADTLGVSFLWVLPRHVRSPGCVARIIEAARFMSPAVIFFEDLDLVGEDRDSSRSAVLGELMNQLDGVSENNGIIAIATTNRLEVVERALRNRPGRFDRVVEVGLPDAAIRRKLLNRLLAAVGMPETDLLRLASTTDGYTPAQLEEVVNTIHLLTAERYGKHNPANGSAAVTSDLIDRALREVGGDRKRTIGFQHD